MRKLPWILLSGMLWISVPLSGQSHFPSPMVLDREDEVVSILPYASFFVDERQQLDILSVTLLRSALPFSPLEAIKYGGDGPQAESRHYWVHFKVTNELDEPVYLQGENYFMDTIFLYHVGANEEVLGTQVTGLDIPYRNRSLKNNRTLFELAIPKGETHDYYLVHPKTNLTNPKFSIYGSHKLLTVNHWNDFADGLLFGALLFIAIYQLLIWITERGEIDQLLYVLYVLSNTFTLAFYKSFGFEFLYPNSPAINDHLITVQALTGLFLVLFTMKFLHITRKEYGFWYWLGFFFIGQNTLLIILDFTPARSWGASIIGEAALLLLLYTLVMGIISIRKGYSPAKYYLMAFFFFFVTAFLYVGYGEGLLPASYFLANAPHYGALTQILFFGLAMGDKYSFYKEKQLEAEQVAMNALKDKEQLLSTQNVMLEHNVRERTQELEKEKDKSDRLLKNILPEETAEELKQYGRAEPRFYRSVSILFIDFAEFTQWAERLNPRLLVETLDEYFREFDRIIGNYDIEKIKTIGDAYLCAAGLPVPSADHAETIVKVAMDILDYLIEKEKQVGRDGVAFKARMGIHTGSVVAGIVGDQKFQYDIWGDAVNMASRMEESSEIYRINISESTYQLVKDQFECTPRGQIYAKNKGKVNMYFVERK
ncbi:MAG: hypothetical protein IPL49_13545 [Saprospirales bacterium]|nr:hypothetical protein [Saprospirales bacterium]